MIPTEICDALRATLPPLFECALAPEGAIRVRTPFMYPDGDIIDLFVEARDADFLLTDYGEALGWLQMQSFSDKLTDSQHRLVEDACQTHGVSLDRGQLTLRCRDTSKLGEAVQRLGQASVRVSDVWFTFRVRSSAATADEVDEWLQARHFDFSRNAQHQGRSGREWSVDFKVNTDKRVSLVFLLSTGTQAWARRMSERVFSACSDLSHLQRQEPRTMFVSLFDDAHGVWRDEDLALVESVSHIATWSRRDEFEEILKTEWEPPPWAMQAQ